MLQKMFGSNSESAKLKEVRAAGVANWHFAGNNQPEIDFDCLDSFPLVGILVFKVAASFVILSVFL